MDATGWLSVVCPDLYGRGADYYANWLTMADSRMSTSAKWGTDTRYQAQAWLAAHLWSRTTQGSPGGLTPTSAQAVGAIKHESASNGRDAAQMRRDYADPHAKLSPADRELHSTVYGAQYYILRQQNPNFGARIINISP
jgi:uncharacterized protein with NAD-binding domain and iron-sulfur cluster